MTRPSELLLNSKQPAVFKLHPWHLTDKHPECLPRFSLVWEREKDNHSRFSSSKGPDAFDSVPMLIPAQPPFLGTAVAATHS